MLFCIYASGRRLSVLPSPVGSPSKTWCFRSVVWIPYPPDPLVQTSHYPPSFDSRRLLPTHVPQYLSLLQNLLFGEVPYAYGVLRTVDEMTTDDRVLTGTGRDVDLYGWMRGGELGELVLEEETS